MATVGENDGNGRITLAILGEQQKEILRRLERIEQKQDAMSDRVSCVERDGVQRETRLKAVETCQDEHDEAIEGLKSSNRIWNGLTVIIAAAISGIVGIFKP